MQASVPGEIRWRVDLYAKSFEFCRAGEFSFARFLALVPDRLRIAIGDRAARIRIPVAVDPALRDMWRERLLSGGGRPEAPKDARQIRRVIRMAQLDPDLDPLWLLGWLREHGDPLLASISEVYRQGLSEIGRGEGGEETAYLIHLLLTENLGLLGQGEGTIPRRIVALTMLELGLEALLEVGAVAGESLPARLAYLFQITLSPFALGVDPDDICRRRINFYRTNGPAVRLARRVLQEPLEVIPLRRVVPTIAKRLALDPEVESLLLQDVLLDLVRDASMLALLQLTGKAGAPPILASICSSETALSQHVLNDRRRGMLLEEISAHATDVPKALGVLRQLLQRAPEVLAGAPEPLGVHGDVEARASLAAAGAVALVLDERTEALKRDVTARVQEVRKSEWEEGRAYRLSLDGRPLYELQARSEEAQLFVDVSELTARATALGARAPGDFLARSLFHPVLDLAARLRGSIKPIRVTSDTLAFRGDIVAVVELASRIAGLVEALARTAAAPASEVLGGRSTRLGEIEEEIAAIERRIGGIDGATRRLAEDSASIAVLADSRSILEEQLTALREIAEETAPRAIRAPAYVSFGARPEEVAVDGLDIGVERITFSSLLDEGRRGTARAPWIERQRAALLANARQARGDERVSFPAQASVQRRARIDLPPALVEELVRAVDANEAPVLASVAAKLAQWLRGEVDLFAASRSRLAALADPPAELYNEGVLLSDDALKAWEQAKRPAVRCADWRFVPSRAPDYIRMRYVFDRDPECFRIARRAEDDEPVALFRYAGDASLRRGTETPLWELLPIDSAFAAGLFRMEKAGDTVRE